MEKKKPLSYRYKLVPESLNEMNFERGGNIKKNIGIGVEALKKEVKDLIDFKIGERYVSRGFAYTSKGRYEEQLQMDVNKLIDLWEERPDLKPGIIDLMKEVSEMPRKFRKDLPYRGKFFLEFLQELGILWEDKYGWINSSNRDVATQIDKGKAESQVGADDPDKIISSFIKTPHSSYDVLRKAAFDGATNTHIGAQALLNVAGEKGDTELIKLLLKNPKIDPTANTPDGKRYNGDDTNYPARHAAKNGHIEAVKAFIEDGRSNLASKNNYALKMAINNGDKEMSELLLSLPNVRNTVDILPNTVINRGKKLGIL
jgi:hypothetical protein